MTFHHMRDVPNLSCAKLSLATHALSYGQMCLCTIWPRMQAQRRGTATFLLSLGHRCACVTSGVILGDSLG